MVGIINLIIGLFLGFFIGAMFGLYSMYVAMKKQEENEEQK